MDESPRRSSTGLIFGKFLPPHRGHVFLVERGRAEVAELTVAVCSLAREPIPGELRFQWMRELCPGARVVHVTDENPSYPHEHEAFWQIWAETLLRAMGGRPPDVLFTSETYGDEMARRLGARHVLVDLQRVQVPIAASAIRTDPMLNWGFIPDCVRSYYLRRVVLIGSECTGKSTLAADLAAHYGTACAPEYGRIFVDAKAAPLVAADVDAIARGQIAGEEALARGANRILIQDTDLISTVVYSRHYFGGCPAWVESAARERLAQLYLLHHPDVPWVPDGLQRDRGDRREEMHGLFREALEDLGARYVDVMGGWEERRARAVRAVDGLLAEPPSA